MIECAEALWSPTTWFVKTRSLNSITQVERFLQSMFVRHEAGEVCTLVARQKVSAEIVGISTYHNPTPEFTRVEIGFTWISERWQRTYVNREMKFLMLNHAFEKLKANRVEFTAHPSNTTSNRALEKIGAVFEGTLKHWRTTRAPSQDDGDRNLYRILVEDWPELSLHFCKSSPK